MLNPVLLHNLCRNALAEDIGRGDATTEALLPPEEHARAVLRAREDCVCAGLPVVTAVFAELNAEVCVACTVQDGDRCGAGTCLAEIEGQARALLSGERTALNFLQRLSGIATLTRAYVDAARGAKVQILDTRKTTPGLRLLEKYAVRMGGASNHRAGLYDRIIIKDNHLALARAYGPNAVEHAVRACREQHPELEVEVEADTLEQVQAAVAAGADYVLLDNMSDDDIAAAVEMAAASKCQLEASGGITLESVGRIARLGVDFISVGALTHSAPAVDIGMDMVLNR
jgi:nicotinate-nucleotide pyrophosphorylase (carboxylating)